MCMPFSIAAVIQRSLENSYDINRLWAKGKVLCP